MRLLFKNPELFLVQAMNNFVCLYYLHRTQKVEKTLQVGVHWALGDHQHVNLINQGLILLSPDFILTCHEVAHDPD